MSENDYPFADDDRASARLQRLARLHEPETRELLRRGAACRPRLAVDLGCGPGWSTRLIREVLAPLRTAGLDSSERYVGEAKARNDADLEFALHDVTRAPRRGRLDDRRQPRSAAAQAVAGHGRAAPGNVRTWRQDEYARRAFDPTELDRLEASLERIAAREEDGGTVLNTARQIVAKRPE